VLAGCREVRGPFGSLKSVLLPFSVWVMFSRRRGEVKHEERRLVRRTAREGRGIRMSEASHRREHADYGFELVFAPRSTPPENG
jgi:hypothetical protein